MTIYIIAKRLKIKLLNHKNHKKIEFNQNISIRKQPVRVLNLAFRIVAIIQLNCIDNRCKLFENNQKMKLGWSKHIKNSIKYNKNNKIKTSKKFQILK